MQRDYLHRDRELPSEPARFLWLGSNLRDVLTRLPTMAKQQTSEVATKAWAKAPCVYAEIRTIAHQFVGRGLS